MINGAAGADREGEAIAWHLMEILKIDETEPCRIEFNEITKDAVKNAVKNPRQLNSICSFEPISAFFPSILLNFPIIE